MVPNIFLAVPELVMFNFSASGENTCGFFITVLKRIAGARQFEQHVKLATWKQTSVERKSIISLNFFYCRVQGQMHWRLSYSYKFLVFINYWGLRYGLIDK